MGNQKSKKTVPGEAVYNRKQDIVTIDTKSDTNDRPNSQQSFVTIDEEQESRCPTCVQDQREGAVTGSSGYVSMANGLSLTSETSRKLLKQTNESAKKQMAVATGGVDESTRKGLNMTDEIRLRRSFRFIKEEIEPDPIVDYFIRDEFMSENDRELIKQAGTRRDQADALLCMLVRMKKEAFEKFLNYLVETKYGYVKEYILDMSEDYEIEKTMLEDLAAKIPQNKNTLIDQFEPDEISEYMVEYGVFSFEEYSKLRDKSLERTKKVEKLIKLILAYQPKSFDVFIHALQKTKGDYCIDVLKNTQTNFEPVAATTSSQKVNITVKAQGTSRTVLKGVDKFELKLEFGENDVELEVVEELNKCSVKLAINNELFDKELVYTNSEKGSVIIQIRVLSQDKHHGIRSELKVSTIQEVLKVFAKHSPTMQRLSGQVFAVKLEAPRAIGKKISKTKMKADPKIMIQRNIALLEEELDAMSLMEDLTLSEVFTEDEGNEILRNGNPRRRERTKRMLLKLLEKDQRAIDVFMEALMQRKRDLVVKHLLDNEGVSLKETGMLEAKNISKMVTDMSPVLIEEKCIAMGIINKNDFDIIRRRESRVNCILQNMLAKTDQEIICIAKVLQWYHEIPTGIFSCMRKQEGKRAIKTTVMRIGEFKIEKDEAVVRRNANAKATHARYIKSPRINEFTKCATSSCSSNESGYASHLSLDSVGHDQRSPRSTSLSPLIHSSECSTTNTHSTVIMTPPIKRLKADTPLSVNGSDNCQGNQMAKVVYPPLAFPTAVLCLNSGDASLQSEKIIKPQECGKLRQITVTPVKNDPLKLPKD